MRKFTHKDMKLSKIYEVSWYDHFSTEDKSSEQATLKEPTVLKSYGVYIGNNKRYVILAYDFESETSENNDNIHILKREIKDIYELRK